MHPDDFMEYVRAGKLVGSTDKSYKFYANDDGFGKFYTPHLSEAQGHEFADLWGRGAINFGDYPPYVRIYLPGPSTMPRDPEPQDRHRFTLASGDEIEIARFPGKFVVMVAPGKSGDTTLPPVTFELTSEEAAILAAHLT